jgi:serine protease AprX
MEAQMRWKAVISGTALVTLATATLAGPAYADTSGGGDDAAIPVIVQYQEGDQGAAAAAVQRLGGTVGRALEIVDSFAAQVPADEVAALRVAGGVVAVTPDGSVRMKGAKWLSDGVVSLLPDVEQSIGAADVWKTKTAGLNTTGKGIGVALIDSGVAPVTGLADSSRIINGPDLSFESQNPATAHKDTFGHGTHMASIIAGADPGYVDGQTSTTNFAGIAPGAKLISVKVATADGASDVSQVIAGIDWVVAHRNDAGLNIRVLNLSFGTNSMQAEALDPLSHAVESAWRKGIVVVVSVGNDGAAGTSVTMPAANPYIISVGAADNQATSTRTDDTVADFSSVGNATRHADLVAPGKSIGGLRDPGSYVDVNYPTGLVPGDVSGRLFRGSGSSQAAAVVSGSVALLLQARPNLTPDQVKGLLMSTADAMPKVTGYAKGAGQLNIKAAVNAASAPVLPAFTQTWTKSTGTGSLEQSRGTAHVADPDTGTELTGEVDIMGKAWNGAAWAAKATSGTAWTGGAWNGSTWTGSAFGTGTTVWSGVTWTGNAWSGRSWTGRSWTDAVWDGRSWTGRSWSGRSWTGRSWCGSTWS